MPALADGVVVRRVDDEGRHVVKNKQKNSFLRLGEEEAFLLAQFDSRKTYGDAIDAFHARYSETISVDDVSGFVGLIRKEKLLESESTTSAAAQSPEPRGLKGVLNRCVAAAKKQSPVFFRVSLFDPNATLNWLEPRTRWLFSPAVAVFAVAGFFAAVGITWTNRDDLVTQFTAMFGWRTLALAWLTTIGITVCHEFGHGLACKRYGGDVHEMGALWIFSTPCLFCNVSDAWLFPSRLQRLIVSMAGTYVDLLIWIVSVFVWRLTVLDSAVNYMAWIIVTTCGLRVIFNANPLMRLDGYYALSDALEIPNLRKRSRARWMEYVRWLLWGADRPQAITDGRALLIYGVTSWFFTVGFLNLMLFQITDALKSVIGLSGFIAGVGLAIGLSKKYFRGSLGGEFGTMIANRKKRFAVWACLVLGILAVPIHDRVGGPFHVRPAVRWEVRAPVDGFLREVAVEHGDVVPAGAVLARFEVPELNSQLTQKAAEIVEVQALLRRLEAGPRQEEVSAQRERVIRAAAWRDLAEQDLGRAKESFKEELASFDLRIQSAEAEVAYRRATTKQADNLHRLGGLSGQELLAEQKQLQVAEATLSQTQSARRAREAEGVMSYEGELARRTKEYADTLAALRLLEAGSRPEDIEAQQARLARLVEERKHLEARQAKQLVVAPAAGVVTTPRLREKIGQFLTKGAELCLVEDQGKLEAEVAIREEDARLLTQGQTVSLKPRSLPFHRLPATVDRIAPSAGGTVPGQVETTAAPSDPRTFTVYCSLENVEGPLRSGMTGYGRVYHTWRPLGFVGVMQTMQFFRTEFWL